jgi:class 3 adenylate cyclase/tetratricopeptide (TPR) repeat protein
MGLTICCASCGTNNPPGQKFCGECGEPLNRTAAAPKVVSPDTYTPQHLADKILTSQNILEGERKQVTVVFADIKGSLELIESSDPEQAHLLLDSALSTMMDAVHRYEGTVNKVLGDGIMALFGAPLALEDHAARACYAALAMQDALRHAAERSRSQFGVEPQIRVGLNSGEVVVRAIGNDLSMDYDAIGLTTHLAGRMEQIAVPGTIRLTQNTLHLAEGFIRVNPLGPVPVKGLDRPIEIYELTGASQMRSRFQAAIARGLSRFVGRGTELAALGRALGRATQGHGEVFGVVGDPGVGKSRLYYEFTHSHRTSDMLIVDSRSVSYGKATAYGPAIELFKAYFGIENRDDTRRIREKVAGKLLTLDESLTPELPALLALLEVPVEDTEWDTLEPSLRRRRMLEAMKKVLLRESQIQPVVIVFEDLHWIDGETQAFLDSLVDSLPNASILLLVNYRPEYHHEWGSRTYYTQRRIDPLPPESTEELLNGLLGDKAELAPLKRLIVARTEGNPFFVEESVRTLVESGALEGIPGAYSAAREVELIEVPATVQDVLVARIDHLMAEDKQLLQTASVIGKDVPFDLLAAITEHSEDALQESLRRLQTAEFLYETRLFPELEYSFKHALTHELAYRSLLGERRRTLHQQIVTAIEQLYADRLSEHVERLAHHAVRGELWEKALGFLRQSGKKAASRSAYNEAAASLEQALLVLQHLPESDETRQHGIDLRFDLRSSLQALGNHERAFEHLQTAEKLASELDDQDRLGWASAYASQYLWRMGHPTQAEASGQRALTIASELNDFALSVVTNFFLAQGHFIAGEYQRAIHHCQQSLVNLQGERAYERLGLTGLPSVLARIWLSWSLAEQGEFREAMVHAGEALSIAETANQPYSEAAACLGVGQAQVIQGALDQAIPMLERTVNLCKTWDLGVIFPTTAVVLGLAYALSGRVAEASSLLEKDEVPISPDAIFIFETSTARNAVGTVYHMAGRLDEALSITSRAAKLAADRGCRGIQARTLHLLGEISVCHDHTEANRAEDYYRQGLTLAEELGMRPLVAHCHRGLGRLYERVGELQRAEEHIATATEMYQAMDMGFWLEQVTGTAQMVE